MIKLFCWLSFVIVFSMLTEKSNEYTNQTLDGKFISTNCQNVESVKIPSWTSSCTEDVFVYLICNKKEKPGFKNKDSEFIENSKKTESKDKIVTFLDTDTYSIQRINQAVYVQLKISTIWIQIKNYFARFFDDSNDYFYLSYVLLSIIIYICVFKLRFKRSLAQSNDENMIELSAQASSTRLE